MSKSSKQNKPENDSPAGGSTPDWMRMAASETDSSSINEENHPDWLKSIQAGKSTEGQAEDSLAEMSDLERLLAEEGIDLGAVEDDRPAEAEGMSARDWLIETSDDELIRNRGRESDEVDLSLDAQPAQPTEAASTPPSSASTDDDPFAGMSDLERMLAEEGIDVTSVEDERPAEAEGKSAREWLLETSDDEMIRNRAKKQEEIDLSLDASQSEPPSEVESTPPPSSASPTPTEPIAPSTDDDPFAGMSDLERMLAEEGIDVGSVEDERPADAAGMSARDYLLSTSDDEMLRNKAGQVQEEVDLSLNLSEEDPTSSSDELPNWLQEDEVSDDTTSDEADEALPDWLQDDSTDDDATSDEADEALPDWLQDDDDDGAPAASEPSVDDSDDDMMVVEDDLPDWLQDDNEADQAESAASEPATAEADEALPDWLADEAAADSPAEETPAEAVAADDDEDELPDWLTSDDDEDSETEASLMQASAEAEGDLMVVEDELPDWLMDDDEGGSAETDTETSSDAKSTAEDDDELPDWLTDDDDSEPETPSMEGSADDEGDLMVVEDELPDWLIDDDEGSDETVAETSTDAESTADDDDELPDWLTDDDDSEPETPSMEGSADDEGDLMVVEDELPDWLMDDDEGSDETVAETSSDAESTADDDDELPDWLADETDTSNSDATTESDDDDDLMVVEDDLPDWLQDEEDASDAEAAAQSDDDDDMMVVEDDLPDWLQDEEDASETEANTIAAQSDDDDDDMMVAEDDLPDWLQDDDSSEIEADSVDTMSASEEEAAAGEEDDLPDWLQDEASSEAETAPPTESEEVDDDELPGWLQEEADDLLADEASDEITEELADEDDLPDWLKEVSDEVAEPLSQELNDDDISAETEDDMPDWLQDAADEIDKESDSLPVLEDDSDEEHPADMPDWLSEAEDGPDGVTAVLAGAAAGVAAAAVAQTDLPDWLQDVQEEEMELETQLPVTSLEAEPETTDAAEVDDTNLPAWLRDTDVEEAEETSAEALDGETTTETESEAEMPEWLAEEAPEAAEPVVEEPSVQVESGGAATESEPQRVEAEAAPVVADSYKGDLPDWLRKLRAGDQQMKETTQLGVFSVPVPMAAPVLTPQYGSQTAQAAPQPAYQAQPIKPPRPEPDANSIEQLEAARNAQQSGNLDVALKTYQSLVSNGVYLDKVIDDLQRATDNTPANHKLYQLMGDAMLRDGRVQSALEAYRQGLASMPR